MATKEMYTTPDRVRRLLRWVNAFDTTTNPTAEQVDAIIENKMEYIDRETGQSFRLSKHREYNDLEFDYWKYGGARIPLSHSGIITPLSTAAGDSLKIFDGSAWTEWVGVMTEGRTGDFWIDEIEGVLHILVKGQVTPYKLFDFTYRYNNGARTLLNDADGVNTTDTTFTVDDATKFPYQGWFRIEDEEIRYNATSTTTITAVERGAFNTTAASHLDNTILFWVPSDIVDACTMLAAADLLTQEDWSSGGMNSGDMPSAQINVKSKIEEWKEKADYLIKERARKSWSVR